MLVPRISPRISLAASGPRSISISSYLRAAAEAGIDFVDIDLTGRTRFLNPTRLDRTVAREGLTVRSVWIPDLTRGRFAERWGHLPELIRELLGSFSCASVVLDWAVPAHDQRRQRLFKDLRAAIPSGTSPSYVVRPGTLVGSREHLDGLTALRRRAEEWDLSIVLDLSGPIDPRWEAEAALVRLLPRLSAVRLGPLASRPPGRGRERATARVLAALADSSFEGTIAIVPRPVPWQISPSQALARSAAEASMQVRARYAAVHDPLPQDLHPEFRHQRWI